MQRIARPDRGTPKYSKLKSRWFEFFLSKPEIVNAKDFGVPQNRERIFIVGFLKSTKVSEFEYPKPIDKKVKFADKFHQPNSIYQPNICKRFTTTSQDTKAKEMVLVLRLSQTQELLTLLFVVEWVEKEIW